MWFLAPPTPAKKWNFYFPKFITFQNHTTLWGYENFPFFFFSITQIPSTVKIYPVFLGILLFFLYIFS